MRWIVGSKCFGRARTHNTHNMSHPTTTNNSDERSDAANNRLFAGILVLVGAVAATVGLLFWPALVVALLVWGLAAVALVLSFVSDDE
ncbi:hypothetical protein ORFS49 [Halorubrum tailed virus]|nr:hypothetical protein ORFS49 [Halorubrum tailed virus]WDY79189.1 hypothetical protein ORF_00004 [Halorubrum tailed virus]